VRIWLSVINEAGGRRSCPSTDDRGDAYLWAKYRDDRRLMKRLADMTRAHSTPRGYYGMWAKGRSSRTARSSRT
jgi:hypothetical protein